MTDEVEIRAAAEAGLSAYLAQEGFSGPRPDRPGAVRFENGALELRLALTDPREVFVQGVGATLGRRGADGMLDLVAVWQLVPEGAPGRDYWRWEYSDQSALDALLARFRELVLRPYVADYWRDPRTLDPVLEQARRERAAAVERDRAESHLRAARKHYTERRFADAVLEFVLAGPLERADRAKLDIARRWLAR